MRAGADTRRAADERAAAAAAARSGGRQAGWARVATGELDVAHGAILYLDDITVSFDGFKALDRLTLSISAGELRCIIGPNGAGKTTMMDVITGKTRPDSGRAFFGSTIDLLRLRENEIAEAGIGRKFQKPTVFEHLTVFENLELALKSERGVRASLFFLLSDGQKQWLEIGMLLIQDPRLLLLDEPVAGMTDEETEGTAELFLALEGSHSLVVVEHDMKFIHALTHGNPAKKVTVLHEGSVLAEGSLADVQSNEKVVEVYLGR